MITKKILSNPASFTTGTKKSCVSILPINSGQFKDWLKKQDAELKSHIKVAGFSANAGEYLFCYSGKGKLHKILLGVNEPLGLHDLSCAISAIESNLSSEAIKNTEFKIGSGLKKSDIHNACVGWGIACYRFDLYKKNDFAVPRLVWPKDANKAEIKAKINSMCIVRTLINIPANDFGPTAIEKAIRLIAADHDAKVKVTKGKALETGYPLVHMVGQANPDSPRLIELKWGKSSHPKLTIVGKGVTFDTGGLNLKPTKFIALMKKDMGGAAHAIALAQMIMSIKLPVRRRLLVPAVENSVAGNAFRPGDIVKSRKGLTVENTNTDAEGRLILADALTAACEDKPDLIIDFATLTGSARAALGQEIPAMFSNNDKLAAELQDISFKVDDPVWRMPLWRPYKRHNKSNIADLHNSAGITGDLMYSALFLEEFLTGNHNWIHLDIFAWESAGRPGRQKGGTDTGLRATYAMLEKRYKK
jgi:leucyl aminopeptidase